MYCWVSWGLGTAGAVSWGTSALLPITSPCDCLEFRPRMMASRQSSKSTKTEASRPLRDLPQDAKQHHFDHIPLVKASHRAAEIQGKGKDSTS